MSTTQPMTTDTQLVVVDDRLQTVVSKAGLEPESASGLIERFRPLFAQANELCASAEGLAVTDATQVSEMKRARQLRLALRAVRIDAEKARKSLKEDSLRRGKAIDGVYNVLEYVVAPVENRLLEMEEFAERAEAARKAKIKAIREELLRPFGVDPALYQLGEMSDAAFSQLHDGVRLAHEQRIAAEKKAEEERIAKAKAEAEERERIRQENERLKREAVEREAKARAEREKMEAEAKAERERAAAERRAQEEKAMRERAALEAKARAEREAKEKAEAEARKMREEQEAKARAEEEARRKREAAPDKEKLYALAALVRGLDVPQMSTEPGKAAAGLVSEKARSFAAWIEKQADQIA